MPEGGSIRWRAFGVPKRGNSDLEAEDACAGDAASGRFAVADGASESAFSREWARLLVQHFIEVPFSRDEWQRWLATVQHRWLDAIEGRDMPWYIEEKFQHGAFATIVGLSIRREATAWVWHAVAVGDSCFFHVRGDAILRKFPILRSVDFDGAPDLIGSRQSVVSRDFWAGGQARLGDRLLLMSDALARWFMEQSDGNRNPSRAVDLVLHDSDPHATFAFWINTLRDAKQIQNDDVTLGVVELVR